MEISKIINEAIFYQNKYEVSVENFNILTNKMNDDYLPFRINQNAMVWINKDGILGEIECIYPKVVDIEIHLEPTDDVTILEGFPIFKITQDMSVHDLIVFKNKEYFVLYLSNSRKYDCKIKSENVIFYVKNLQVVGIKAILS